MSLHIEVEPSLPFSTTFRLEGRLDNDTASVFDAQLESALDSDVRVLVMDLAKLDYFYELYIGDRDLSRKDPF